MSSAEDIVAVLLEDSPFSKKPVELEYRPYKSGDDWKWFWVLHPEGRQRAVAHGEADSRAAASTEARLRARQLKSVITKVTVAAYAKRFEQPAQSLPQGNTVEPSPSIAPVSQAAP